MALTLVTAPSELPVTLAEAKAWCGAEDTSNDTVIGLALSAACKMVEAFTGRALGAQVWRLTLDEFADAIELARAPVLSLASGGFTYVDEVGDTRVVDSAIYSLDLFSDPAWIVLNSDAAWPTIQDTVNAVQVQFNTGYTADLLPDDMKAAVLITTAAMFEDRTLAKLPAGALSLLAPFRRWVI